jgi:hypothetical protein
MPPPCEIIIEDEEEKTQRNSSPKILFENKQKMISIELSDLEEDHKQEI